MGIISKEQAMVDGLNGLRLGWETVMGKVLPDELACIIAGQCWGENHFGRRVEGDYQCGDTSAPRGTPVFPGGSNNRGNIQATHGWCVAHAKDVGWGYILEGDVHADGTPYVFPYRAFPIIIYADIDYFQFLKGRVDFDAVHMPADYAQALKHIGYYEAPLGEYTQMIASGAAFAKSCLGSALAPCDVTASTGDDRAPWAMDGKHLPGRFTVWTALDPPAGAFDVAGDLGA